MHRTPAVLGLGTAVPPHVVTQTEAAERLACAFSRDRDAVRLVRGMFRRAGVERRHCVIPGGGFGPAGFYAGASPGTDARMRAFREHAPPLAEAAARRALSSAGVSPGAVTDLVVVTCTGLYAPGPDVDLVTRLGLAPSVRRTLVAFMGCYGAFNGLRVARQAVAADRTATALVVCVELCSLHFRADPIPDNVIADALFGDGAAAVVVGAAEDPEGVLLRLGAEASHLAGDTQEHMGWEIGDDGFRMRLSSYVPELLVADLREFVRPLEGGRDVASWCVHPGGPAILAHVEASLGLAPEALDASRGVLRDLGNVSSGTVLFVLERELARTRPGDVGVMLGFGPGLTLEGLAFERGARTLAGAGLAARVPV